MADDFTPHFITPERPLETVKIVTDETEVGFMIINKSDFDPKTMKKYKEPAAPADGNDTK